MGLKPFIFREFHVSGKFREETSGNFSKLDKKAKDFLWKQFIKF